MGVSDEIKLHQFAEKLELRGYSRRSIADYPYNVGRFLHYLQEKENVQSSSTGSLSHLAEVSPEHITAYHTHLQYGTFRGGRHLSSGTVVKRLEALRVFYRLMHAEGLIQQDHSGLIAPPKQRRGLPRHVPSEKQMLALLEAIQPTDTLTIRDRALFELLYATGLRSEEARSVTVENLDLTERTLFVTGKGAKDRIVPVGDWVMPFLLEYLEKARPRLINVRNASAWLGNHPAPQLFVSKTGRQITSANLGDLVRKYATKAGLDIPLTPHSFRHACATHLLKGGADIRYVQELLGHSDLSSTQIYTRVDISMLKAAHKRYHPRERGVGD